MMMADRIETLAIYLFASSLSPRAGDERLDGRAGVGGERGKKVRRTVSNAANNQDTKFKRHKTMKASATNHPFHPYCHTFHWNSFNGQSSFNVCSSFELFLELFYVSSVLYCDSFHYQSVYLPFQGRPS